MFVVAVADHIYFIFLNLIEQTSSAHTHAPIEVKENCPDTKHGYVRAKSNFLSTLNDSYSARALLHSEIVNIRMNAMMTLY